MAQDPTLNQSVLKPPADVNPRREPVLDFPDKRLREMSAADYETLGFMSGLEVHQQLHTRSKLFCRCPAGVYVDHFDAEVLRHMRPTLSELGEYDGTALMEFKTRKEIVYQLERGTVCTYEIDDTPPFYIDEEAVRVALEVSRLFDLKLVSELHVMRKQYLDGSIPAGFQRTAMLGLGGSIPFRVPELGIDRELNIRQLSLEEDSCREISDIGHRITFRTDRLGIPLTEVVTEPELLTPWELQAGARLVTHTTRVSGKVRRGNGAARQDVNVSVAGGRRVEIKGVHHHKGLPKLTHIEGFRQLNLLRVREELHRRGVTHDRLTLPTSGVTWEHSSQVIDASSTLRHCAFAPIHDALHGDEMAAALCLPGFAGLLVHRTQPGVTLANEFADRVRVIACLTGRPFMIHSDIEGYGVSHAEWRQLRKALRAKQDDTVVVLWGPARDVDTGVREVFLRAIDALDGVPAETRQAYPDGTTGFERILPGADRMYPDTDTPPVAIPDAWVEQLEIARPERPWEREDRYEAQGLAPAMAARLAVKPWATLFDALNPKAGDAAARVASALEKRIPWAWRERQLLGSERALPPTERVEPLVRALENGSLRAEGFEAALDRVLLEDGVDVAAVLAERTPADGDDARLQEQLDAMLLEAPKIADKSTEIALRWAMGQVMPILLGKLDPTLVSERIEAALATMSRGG